MQFNTNPHKPAESSQPHATSASSMLGDMSAPHRPKRRRPRPGACGVECGLCDTDAWVHRKPTGSSRPGTSGQLSHGQEKPRLAPEASASALSAYRQGRGPCVSAWCEPHPRTSRSARLQHLAQRLKPRPVKRGRRRVRRRLRESGQPTHRGGGAGGAVARGRTGLRGVEGREQVAVPDVHVMRRGHLAGRAPDNHAELPLRRGGKPGGRGREAQPLKEAEE